MCRCLAGHHPSNVGVPHMRSNASSSDGAGTTVSCGVTAPNRERKKQAMSHTKPDQPVPLATTRSGVSDIQALVFDTYGTVVDWRAGVLEALVALGGSRGLTVDWEAFLSDWQTRPIMDRVNRGELPWMTME